MYLFNWHDNRWLYQGLTNEYRPPEEAKRKNRPSTVVGAHR